MSFWLKEETWYWWMCVKKIIYLYTSLNFSVFTCACELCVWQGKPWNII